MKLLLQDHDVGTAAQIRDPVSDQLGATGGNQPIPDDRYRLLERPALSIEFISHSRICTSNFSVGRCAR